LFALVAQFRLRHARLEPVHQTRGGGLHGGLQQHHHRFKSRSNPLAAAILRASTKTNRRPSGSLRSMQARLQRDVLRGALRDLIGEAGGGNPHQRREHFVLDAALVAGVVPELAEVERVAAR
jgi:hypothetical protein